ncbi:MAG TPA: efflux transporter outer membrane subunit, partial [Stellaceae bacterium]|nr:efflux transporter outer membrane subunit [Stellaceae bacterium]
PIGGLPMGGRALPGLAVALLGLAACTVGPDYQRPDAPVPAAYKEAWKPAPAEKGWRETRPADAIDRGAWWSIFRDPVLDGLERQIDISNQNLKSADAAFRQAEAVVAGARAQFFPTAAIDASATRSRSSGNGGPTSFGGGRISNRFQLDATASWVPDLWGSVRRTVEGDVASAQASAGLLASARLSAQAQLAAAYLQIRTADELARLLEASVKAFAQNLQIVRNQFRAGTADHSAVDQAQAQLESTRAQLVAVGVTRAQLEHAIAVLIGKPPAALTIPPTEATIAVPVIPAGLPSALIERRPDIATAERRMQAANAQIGVAVAAFYPNVTLTADYGVAASMLRRLLTTSSRLWSFGSTAAETIFDGGAHNAQVEQQRAAYDGNVADYRQTVLAAFQQVEDALASQRILAEQAKAQDAALAAARSAERTINNQYLAGTQAYTAVIVAQTTALNDAVQVVNLRQSRLAATVALIEALGGGWDASRLPSRDKIESDAPLNFNPLPPKIEPNT